jgi:hypothetical protein
VGLRHDPVAHAVVQSARDGLRQESPRVLVAQAPNLQLRQPPKLLPSLPRGEHEPDRLGKQPSRDERERASRCLIQPLRVIQYAQQWTLLHGLRNRVNTPKPTRNRSGAGPSLRPNTISSTSRFGPGSRSTRSSMGAQS